MEEQPSHGPREENGFSLTPYPVVSSPSTFCKINNCIPFVYT